MTHLSQQLETWSMPPASARRLPISSEVISGLAAAIDSCTILCVGAILYVTLVSYSADTFGFYISSLFFIWIATLLIFQFSGIYHFDALLDPISCADKILFSLVASFLFLLAVAFSFKISATFSRLWIGAFAGGVLVSTFLVRMALSRLILRFAQRGVFTRNVIVAGSGEYADRLLRRIRQLRPDFISVTGVFVNAEMPQPNISGIPTLGALDDITSFIRRAEVDDVVIALPWSDEPGVLSIVDQLRELPVNVYLASNFAELDFREPPSHFGSIPMFSVIGRPLAGWGSTIKALEDYALASLAALVLLPVMALVALAVKLDSPGPVLFRQRRLGFNNKEFDIYKFRTMRHRPETEDRTIQATRGDSRVTRIGQFLRRSSLDELPQLFNVLNGTMSLVGPRPHAIDHNEEYSRKIRWYFARHRVKPGMTGWAQVHGLRGETKTNDKMEARVRHDIFYAENWSLFFDIKILLRTVLVLVARKNAY